MKGCRASRADLQFKSNLCVISNEKISFIHPSVISSTYPVRAAENVEPIAADFGNEAALDVTPWTGRQSITRQDREKKTIYAHTRTDR